LEYLIIGIEAGWDSSLHCQHALYLVSLALQANMQSEFFSEQIKVVIDKVFFSI